MAVLPILGNGCGKKVKVENQKVDDKPMVIHTKESKNSSIKVKEGEYRLLQDGGAESKENAIASNILVDGIAFLWYSLESRVESTLHTKFLLL